MGALFGMFSGSGLLRRGRLPFGTRFDRRPDAFVGQVKQDRQDAEQDHRSEAHLLPRHQVWFGCPHQEGRNTLCIQEASTTVMETGTGPKSSIASFPEI